MNMKRTRLMGISVSLAALMLVSAACSKKASTGGTGSGGMTIKITSPSDGASVSNPVTFKLDTSVPLGDPSTGNHHVHICIDVTTCGANYTIAYGGSVQVSGLTPGKHTVVASLRNADHSDAGVSTSITITVTGGSGGTSPTPTKSGYGY